MLTSLTKLSTETEEIQKTIQKLAESKLLPALKEAFTELKAVVPTLEAIRWEQYTPYFNDGDACTFGLHGVYFRLEGVDDEAGDYEDGFLDSWSLDTAKLAKPQVEALENFETQLNHVEDLLEEAIGDHMQVTLTSEGIETEEYSHD